MKTSPVKFSQSAAAPAAAPAPVSHVKEHVIVFRDAKGSIGTKTLPLCCSTDWVNGFIAGMLVSREWASAVVTQV